MELKEFNQILIVFQNIFFEKKKTKVQGDNYFFLAKKWNEGKFDFLKYHFF